MNTHEMLNQICDKIGHQMPGKLRYSNESGYWNISTLAITDEREIIFTQEFIDKLKLYIDKNICPGYFPINSEGKPETIKVFGVNEIINNLSNPTLYIYNLLDLGTK